MSHLSYLCLCCLIISDFQQKYVVLKAMRRSGDTYIKNVIMKKMKSKVYVSFRISLYIMWPSIAGHFLQYFDALSALDNNKFTVA